MQERYTCGEKRSAETDTRMRISGFYHHSGERTDAQCGTEENHELRRLGTSQKTATSSC